MLLQDSTANATADGVSVSRILVVVASARLAEWSAPRMSKSPAKRRGIQGTCLVHGGRPLLDVTFARLMKLAGEIGSKGLKIATMGLRSRCSRISRISNCWTAKGSERSHCYESAERYLMISGDCPDPLLDREQWLASWWSRSCSQDSRAACQFHPPEALRPRLSVGKICHTIGCAAEPR